MSSRTTQTSVNAKVTCSDESVSSYLIDLEIYEADEIDEPEITTEIFEGELNGMGIEWNDAIREALDQYIVGNEITQKDIAFTFSETTNLVTPVGHTVLKKVGKLKK
jgi:hypothetical protein